MHESAASPSSADFVSRHPWSADRPQALVICCSDGRWQRQIEDFIARIIPGGARADLYAIPGGPAAFNAMTASLMESSSIEMSFRFLADHHQLRAVWLIAHEGCAFYAAKKVGHSPEQLRRSQIDDLAHAGDRIRLWYRDMEIVRVYASRRETEVRFTIVEGR